MANKVKYGLRNIYYSKMTVSGGTVSYATPVAMPGAVSLTASPVGDSVDFNADDIIYFQSTANQGYEGELEVSLINESFLTDIMKFTKDSNGALVESADIIPESFALGFEIQGDSKPRRTWFYNCTCARPNADAKTKETGINPDTEKLSIKMMPRGTDHNVKVSLELTDDNTSAYNSFFSAVYESSSSI